MNCDLPVEVQIGTLLAVLGGLVAIVITIRNFHQQLNLQVVMQNAVRLCNLQIESKEYQQNQTVMKYEDRVVAFIDLLGFSRLVLSTDNDSEASEKELDRIHEALVMIGDHIPREDVHGSKQVTNISDSLIISFEVHQESEVFWSLYEIQALIMRLLFRGFACRGAVTRGRLIHDEKVMVGPAFIRVYEMEKSAVYPRVVVDQSVIDAASIAPANHHSIAMERNSIQKLLRKDYDGLSYINYIYGVDTEMDDPYPDYRKYLEEFRRIAVNMLDASKMDIQMKGGWMASRYNNVVRKIIENMVEWKKDNKHGLVEIYQGIQPIDN